ncbi:MAG: sodium-translocating pyrophosphatase [Candidatus Micrarchaeia archaeon]|jgi:K(+)-stimulated pyrophosphate-energized sodium pump
MLENVLPMTAGAGVIVLAFAAYLAYSVLKLPAGTEKMKSISAAIKEGAMAYLSRQYKTLVPLVVVIALIIGVVVGMAPAVAFVVGVGLSAIAGYVGMVVSVNANVRTAKAAENGLAEALGVAVKGGSVTGLALVGLGLIGLSAIIYFNQGTAQYTIVLIAFGFGASLMSLFARVGGGIYTKAADVGADLVGKLEKGIPEDDPRNPAVIADNVGDNVGDCAGMAADLFESYVVTIVAAMLLGLAAADATKTMLPLVLAAGAAVASIFGIYFVRLGKKNKVMNALYKGVMGTAALSAAYFYYITVMVLNDMNLFYATLVGVATTGVIILITEYYTAREYGPVKSIAKASQTGAATNLIQGLAIGMEATALPVLTIVAAVFIAYAVGGMYGIAIAVTAMLSMTAIIITLDAYGPITDNAGGIAEMSGLPEKVRKVTDELDAVGNTTKATTKGFAIAGAALGALALFAAYATEAKLTTINLLNPAVVIGLFLGALLPFLFASMLMRAVGRAAFDIVEEVRRQFREIKGIMAGTAKPDYAKCVDISAAAALKELVVPGVMAVASPVVVGYVFGVEALGGLLAGSIASGFLLAVFMSTGGGAWDNAKKYIEGGAYGGKGSDAHKAAVVGDTVGDPFKDTAGPALNSLIKVLNTVALIVAGVLVTAVAIA